MSWILSLWTSIADWWLSWFLWLWEVCLFILVLVMILILIPGGHALAIAGIPVWAIVTVLVVIAIVLWLVLAFLLAVLFMIDLFLNFFMNWRRVGCKYAWRRYLQEFRENSKSVMAGAKKAVNDAIQNLPGMRWIADKMGAAADGAKKFIEEVPTYWKAFKKWIGF